MNIRFIITMAMASSTFVGVIFSFNNQLQNSNSNKNSYHFINYNSVNTGGGIRSDFGTNATFDLDNNLIYSAGNTGDGAGGISLGILKDNTYQFENYNDSVENINSNNGTGVAFGSDKEIAYSCNPSQTNGSGGLSVGYLEDNNYSFKLYDSSADGITSNVGESVAFSQDGSELAYASNGGGLSVGDVSDQNYTFQNYTSATTNFGTDQGEFVTFYQNGTIAYTSQNGGLTVGTSITGISGYNFNTYNTSNTDGILSDSGSGIAFDYQGDIAYTSSTVVDGSGGISLGKRQGNGLYQFRNFNTRTNSGIPSNSGTSVAFAKNGDIAYATSQNGFCIGVLNGDDYNFTNYTTFNSNIGDDEGTSVAFANNGDIAYTSTNGGLTVGFLQISSNVLAKRLGYGLGFGLGIPILILTVSTTIWYFVRRKKQMQAKI